MTDKKDYFANIGDDVQPLPEGEDSEHVLRLARAMLVPPRGVIDRGSSCSGAPWSDARGLELREWKVR